MIDFEDRMKSLEHVEGDRAAQPGLSTFIRLDGKGFSKFTKDMDYPFDSTFSNLMLETAQELMEEFHPDVVYVGSDEITLYWKPFYAEDVEDGRVLPYGGRFQKLVSLTAGRASAVFSEGASYNSRECGFKVGRDFPYFDSRMWQVPPHEAKSVFLWRYYDVQKNAISKVASLYASHKKLQGVSTEERKALIAQNIDYEKAYSIYDRKGAFLVKVREEKQLDEHVLARIPEGKRPTGPIYRNVTKVVYEPPEL